MIPLAIAFCVALCFWAVTGININIRHTQVFRDDTPDPDLFDDPSDEAWDDAPPEELDVVAMNHQDGRKAS